MNGGALHMSDAYARKAGVARIVVDLQPVEVDDSNVDHYVRALLVVGKDGHRKYGRYDTLAARVWEAARHAALHAADGVWPSRHLTYPVEGVFGRAAQVRAVERIECPECGSTGYVIHEHPTAGWRDRAECISCFGVGATYVPKRRAA